MEQQQEMQKPVALIVGVTGMAGLSLAEALKGLTAPAGPWTVYGAARRPKPTTWFPSSILDRYITFDAVNLNDTKLHLSPISNQVTHIFWVAIQVRDTEEANVAVNSLMLSNVLNVLTSSPGSRLRHITIQTGTKHYMGPIFDSAHSGQLVPHDPPFMEDSPRLPFPNFYYALEDFVASYAASKGFTWSVHRSSIIIGASARSVYNALLTLAVYASICRHEGKPFRYPGTRYTWDHFCDMSDARVLAEQQIWAAAVSETAKNQAFNCTNGDVFTWKSLWKVLCEIFEVEFLPFNETETFDWVAEMKEKGSVWDAIVEENGLCKTKMEEITCFSALNMVLQFKFQHVCSMNKSREFGFFGYVDTLKSMGMWVEKLRYMKIIPPTTATGRR
ncbi:(S)-8-oxocitronellyl enol synthase CYC2-like [Macadamia integrifolia]|uniref:(S)-8-oxocitronellyl enol synthase CYC2-like n=1 Tax=Macadamia integrifolia TaxID=60698 RepID=UPI001C50202E|nr:(S)-8-oxocitronellyl enol synthase CYC2-like [Macadamia integrifolia]